MAKIRIAIDLDGVITKSDGGHTEEDYRRRRPNREMIDYIEKLSRLGFHVAIFTARYPEDREVTEEWLLRYDVQYDELVMGKYVAEIYLKCDRTMSIEELDKYIQEKK